MDFCIEERLSDSPYIETITHGTTLREGITIRPAECHWHMVFVRVGHQVHYFVVGPWTTAGRAAYGADAEILWIKFKLGTFMPHWRVQSFLDQETALSHASHQSFWLDSMCWQLPRYEQVEGFITRMVRQETLMYDPLVGAVLRGEPHDYSLRTIRHRFLRTTGLTQNHIQQVSRAKQAVVLLQNGHTILDTVYEVGYFDQAHLTRSLKQFIGYTPSQITRVADPLVMSPDPR